MGSIDQMLYRLKERVRIRFIDVPIHDQSLPYDQMFLFAWLEYGNTDLRAILRIRELLYTAAQAGATPQRALDFLSRNNIKYKIDPNAAQQIFNKYYVPLYSQDQVDTTPSIVVVMNGERTLYSGHKDIESLISAFMDQSR